MKPADVWQVANLHAELDFGGWNENQWKQAVETYPFSWVLESDKNEIIGYISYQALTPQVELLNLGIAREFQGKGLGFGFVQATLNLLPPISEAVYLEVRRSNVPAIELYQKLGFHKVGERPNYYRLAGGISEDAFIYRLDFSK